MKKATKVLLSGMLMASVLVLGGCGNSAAPKEEKSSAPAEKKASIVLATTTSTQQTGLLDYLVPKFTEETGIEVKVVAVGTGQALKMGEDGEADVLLVHAKASEEEFVAKGFGTERKDVMYNDFVLVGPKDDSQVGPVANGDILTALKIISENGLPFVSRGDDSGTHKKELALWEKDGIQPAGDWYISAGKGMGEVLTMANEKKAYTLSDRGTFLSMEDKLTDEKIVVEKSKDLLNQYGVIPVNPDKNPNVHAKEGQAFADWITSEKVQKMIGEFGVDKYGQALFVPNAAK